MYLKLQQKTGTDDEVKRVEWMIIGGIDKFNYNTWDSKTFYIKRLKNDNFECYQWIENEYEKIEFSISDNIILLINMDFLLSQPYGYEYFVNWVRIVSKGRSGEELKYYIFDEPGYICGENGTTIQKIG